MEPAMKYRTNKELIKEKLYYFDRLTINSPVRLDDLPYMLPLDELRKHCAPGSLIYEASNTGKYNRYRSKIDARVCDDIFVELIKDAFQEHGDFGNLTYTEPACEYVTWEAMYAIILGERFGRNTIRNWSRGKRFDILTTIYQGKEMGKPSSNYNTGYIRDSKVLDPGKPDIWTPQNMANPCFKVEFRISGTANIKRVVKIDSILDLGAARNTYRMLFKRYIKVPKINNKKVRQVAEEYYTGLKKCRTIIQEMDKYYKIKLWLKEMRDEIEWKNTDYRNMRDIDQKIINEVINERYFFA